MCLSGIKHDRSSCHQTCTRILRDVQSSCSRLDGADGRRLPAIVSNCGWASRWLRRLSVARTVEAAIPTRRATSRVARPPTNFNRRISRTWRIVVLSAGIRSLPWNSQRSEPESASRGTGPRARSSRNGGRDHFGTAGEIISEWVGDIIPESWAASVGISTFGADRVPSGMWLEFGVARSPVT